MVLAFFLAQVLSPPARHCMPITTLSPDLSRGAGSPIVASSLSASMRFSLYAQVHVNLDNALNLN
jgi:hypothetical protein